MFTQRFLIIVFWFACILPCGASVLPFDDINQPRELLKVGPSYIQNTQKSSPQLESLLEGFDENTEPEAQKICLHSVVQTPGYVIVQFTEKTSILDMSKDCLGLIFAKLSVKGIRAARLVCRAWNDVLSTKTFSDNNPQLKMPYNKVKTTIDRWKENPDCTYIITCLPRDNMLYEDSEVEHLDHKSLFRNALRWPHGNYRRLAYQALYEGRLLKNSLYLSLAYSYTVELDIDKAESYLADYEQALLGSYADFDPSVPPLSVKDLNDLRQQEMNRPKAGADQLHELEVLEMGREAKDQIIRLVREHCNWRTVSWGYTLFAALFYACFQDVL